MKAHKVPLFPPTFFNVYKEKGMSSTDVVRHFKYHLPKGFGKIGHVGTLDPFAEGVLLIAVAGATRASDLLHDNYGKTYLATGFLGKSTTTGDLTGEELKAQERLPDLSFEKLNAIAGSFVGSYMQVPPSFSAAKFEGKSLYKHAREGNLIQKESVKREIFGFEIIKIENNLITFRCTVSSGTYIRTLFEDFCHGLQSYGHLISLKRESIGPINWESSLKKHDWPTRGDDFCFNKYGICPGSVISEKSLSLDPDNWIIFKNGQNLHVDQGFGEGEYISLFSPSGRLCAIALSSGGNLKPIVRFSPFVD